jgi:tetratricopeptide (TPR) repeat protein
VTDSQRILELRRRVQQDPASLAFAQLAEELRRDGNNDEAVAVCRAGLSHHPNLLTARVTLGRALVELDRLDEALDVLTAVLNDAPGNLASMRALAEIYQRRGLVGEALMHYRRAMELAQGDLAPARDTAHGGSPADHREAALERKVEALFDFDSLLAQLGGGEHDRSPVPDVPPSHSVIENVPLADGEPDELAIVEQQLRDRELRLMLEAQARHLDEGRRRRAAVQELEQWLAAIVSEPRSTPYR